MSQSWGGAWTQQKLVIIEKYLNAYMQIFKNNSRASYFKTIYIDAFAGCGKIYNELEDKNLFDEEFQEYSKGSVMKAIELENKFDKYIFIEKDSTLCDALEEEMRKYKISSEIIKGDANNIVSDICKNYDWKKYRAVLFLDPYGMQVQWKTIKAIAKTQAIDMWYLFPLGVGTMRLLKKDGDIEEGNRNKLNELFGDNEWEKQFYKVEKQLTLFGESEKYERVVDSDFVNSYLTGKLKKEFTGVVEKPKILYNSKNSPIYSLCFAAGNKKGAGTAINIAQDLITNMEKR